jgi:hypothetical protein
MSKFLFQSKTKKEKANPMKKARIFILSTLSENATRLN